MRFFNYELTNIENGKRWHHNRYRLFIGLKQLKTNGYKTYCKGKGSTRSDGYNLLINQNAYGQLIKLVSIKPSQNNLQDSKYKLDQYYRKNKEWMLKYITFRLKNLTEKNTVFK